MFIVMHCGGIPFNGDTLKTKSLGGSESAAYYLAKELARAGHKVTLFTNSEESGVFDDVKYEYAGDPSADAPLGNRFTFYAENTPHDVLIIQRHPQAFARKWASKLNYWWLHDIAQGRFRDMVSAQMWNVDRVLCVSEFHKAQVSKEWGVENGFITVMHNGVDLSLFEGDIECQLVEQSSKNLIYSSRPERGLENLVGEGGVMERLNTTDPEFHLYVCGYENTTAEMKPLYDYLYARCDALPNVTNLGALTKQDLADTMRQCTALAYPTTFEEVSCITAMEAMAAGCLTLTCAVAALPETCTGSLGALLPLVDGAVDVDKFTSALTAQVLGAQAGDKAAQRALATKFTWEDSARIMLNDVTTTFAEAGRAQALAFHFIRHSDIPALEHVMGDIEEVTPLSAELLNEYEKAYAFYRDNTYAEHYKAYYQYEKDRGVVYGPEDATKTSRFRTIANMVGELPAGSSVLDYGCAHGHYTVPLAKMFPALTFTGADITQSNLDSASKWADDEKLQNAKFVKVECPADVPGWFDLVIAAEVIEHVDNPRMYVDGLAEFLNKGGRMVITVPLGPWEAQGYRQHNFWRAHLHHFERQDLADMLGHFPDYNVVVAPCGQSKFHSPLGSYIVSFSKPRDAARPINYARKISETMPDQTITLCMIVKDASQDIERCLASVLPHVQEVIIGVDETSTDDTWRLLGAIAEKNPLIGWSLSHIPSALTTGFAAARNYTISKASGDWILWMDADEVLTNGGALARVTRHSQINGFAIKQHHFSTDPMGVLKVDLPCRLFRNRQGIEFFGRVHEHPERALNEGLGPVMLMPHAEIAHYGYKDENIRRQRFARNISLLAQDRKELPDRVLGKFLWLRDLAQVCKYDLEEGAEDRAVFERRADEGIILWVDLVKSGNLRIALDGLEFYSQLSRVKGGGFEFSFTAAAGAHYGDPALNQGRVITAHFAIRAHVDLLLSAIADDQLLKYESRYF